MKDIEGNIQGLKARQIQRIQASFRRRVKGDALLTVELARHLADLSREVNRQLGALIDRSGQLRRVIVGEPHRLYLPDIGRHRGGVGRLRGLRFVRTELRGQGLTREDLADLSKLRLDAVVVVEVDPSGNPQQTHWAHLQVDGPEHKIAPAEFHLRSPHELPEDGLALVREAEVEISRRSGGDAKELSRASALLVGVWKAGPKARAQAESSMEELKELARTAGVYVVEEVVQLRRQIDPRTVLGSGKLEEITLRALELGSEVLIFDRELSPSQLRAITNHTDLKVLDRTQLILDIFAQHAKSRDGKLQVELAQLKYTLPRLADKSTAMSRLAGGIGGQGPGETKLEIHRRRARDRIHRLEQEIEKLSVRRGVRRARRAKTDIPVVSIVGYTNAGKSTLLNALTQSEVIAEDKLFATLDPTTRRLRFPEQREIILTDTVGFIRDLPKDLVNAFKATLEELEESQLILHVLDASDPMAAKKREAVEGILEQLELSEVPRQIVLNKQDQTMRPMLSVLRRVTGGVAVSAVEKTGLGVLSERIEELIFQIRRPGRPEPEFPLMTAEQARVAEEARLAAGEAAQPVAAPLPGLADVSA